MGVLPQATGPRLLRGMRRLLLCALAGLLLVSCAANAPETANSVAPAAVTLSSALGWRQTVMSVDGDAIDLAVIAGDGALFWFWAPY